MFEGYVVYYLNKYLGAYVQNINSDDLKLHLLSGNVVLRDLQLRPEALNSLDLPLTVKAGMLGTLKLKIPWRSLGKEPVIVEFDRLYILAVPPETNVGTAGLSPEEAKERDRKTRQNRVRKAEAAFIKDLEERAKAKLKEATKSGGIGGRFGPLINTVLGNLQVRITRVHVRYEDGATCPGVRMASGVTLQKISAQTVDETGRETFVATDVFSKLRKSAVLERLSVYCDVDDPVFYSGRDRAGWQTAGGIDAWDSVFLPGIEDDATAAAAAAAATAVQSAASAIQAAPPAAHFYLLRPLNGRMMYTRKGKGAAESAKRGRGESPPPPPRELRGSADADADPTAVDDPAQGATLQLDALALRLSDTHWRALTALSEEIGMYRRRMPHARLRPLQRPLPDGARDGKVARQWWVYAITAVSQGLRRTHRIDWNDIRKFATIRKQYVPYYADRILAVTGAKVREKDREPFEDATVTAWDEQLDERQIITFRKMAHARVYKMRQEREKSVGGRRAVAAEPSAASGDPSSQKRGLVSRWFGWGTAAAAAAPGGSPAFDKGLKTVPDVTPESIPDPDQPPPSLSSQDMEQLESFIHEQGDWKDAGEDEGAEEAEEEDTPQLGGGAGRRALHPWFLQLRLVIKTQEMSIGLVQGGSDLCHVGIHGFCARILQYPDTLAGSASIHRLEALSSVGPLITSSPTAIPTGTPGDVLSVNFVSKPQDGSADQIVEASLAPLFITYDRAALQRIRAFFMLPLQSFSTSTAAATTAVDPSTAAHDMLQSIGREAAEQAEQLRRRAEQRLQYALLSKKRVLISLNLAAPKIAIPLHALSRPEENRASSIFSVAVIDMGQVSVTTNDEVLEDLPLSPEARALYHCYGVSISQIVLYFADGPQNPTPTHTSSPPLFSWELHPRLLELMTARPLEDGATARDDTSGWVALPFVQRVRAEATAMVARVPHPSYAKVFLDLRLPSIDVQVSPHRVNRLLRLLRAVTAPVVPPDAAPKPALQTWLASAQKTGATHVLRVGLLRAGATWQPHCAALWDTSLYFLESEASVRAKDRVSVGEGWEVRRVPFTALASRGIKPPEEGFGDGGFGIVIVPIGTQDPLQTVLRRDAVLFLGESEESTRAWYAALTATNVADRSDALAAEALLSSDGSELGEGRREPGSLGSGSEVSFVTNASSSAAAAAGRSPGIVLRGELSRLRVVVSGVGPRCGWEKDVLGGLHTAATAAAAAGSSLPLPPRTVETVLDVASERPLVLLTAGDAGLLYRTTAGPGSIAIEVGLGALHVQDLLLSRPLVSLGRATEPASLQAAASVFARPDSDILLVPKSEAERREDGATSGEDDAFFEPTFLAAKSQVLPLLLGQAVSLSSEQTTAEFALINLAMIQPFHPHYQGVTTDLEVRFAAITLHASRPTAAAFTVTGLAFARALPPPIPEATPPPPPPPPPSAGVSQPAPLDLIGARVRLNFEGVRVILGYERLETRPFAIAEMSSWHLEVSTGPRGVDLLTTLGNVHVSDGSVPVGHPYRRILATKTEGSDSLVRMRLLYTATTPDHLLDRCPAGLPTVHVDLRMSELRALYLNRFISELLAFIHGYLDMRAALPPPPKPHVGESPGAHGPAHSAPAPAVTLSSRDLVDGPHAATSPVAGALHSPKPGAGGEADTAPPMAILLDLDMDAPVVVMPRGTDAPDHLEADLGRVTVSNRVGWLKRYADSPAAVLVDDLSVQLTQLRARTSAEKGSPATDLLIEEGSVFHLDLRRPLRDPFKVLPGTDMRISMPSFRGRLSDKQFLFITAVSQANLNEDMRIPLGAFYKLKTAVTAATPAPTTAAAPTAELVPLAALDRAPPLSLQLRLSIGEVQLTLENALQLPGMTGPGAWRKEPLASAALKGLSLNLRQKAHGGGMALDLSLPLLELRDRRPARTENNAEGAAGIPVLSSSGVGSILGGDGQLSTEAGTPAAQVPPSTLLVLHYDQSPTDRAVKLLLQQPTMAVETAFLLSMLRFFAPGQGQKGQEAGRSLGAGNGTQPFISLDVRLPVPTGSPTPTVIRLGQDLFLGPASRLLWDHGPAAAGEIVLDLGGHTLWLPDSWPLHDVSVPLILLGPGRRLTLRNGTVMNAGCLGAAVQLAAGASLHLDPEAQNLKLQMLQSAATLRAAMHKSSSDLSSSSAVQQLVVDESGAASPVPVPEYHGLILAGSEFLVPIRARPQPAPVLKDDPESEPGQPEAPTAAPIAPEGGFRTEVVIEAVGCCLAVTGTPRATDAAAAATTAATSSSAAANSGGSSAAQTLLRHSLVALLDLNCQLSMGAGVAPAAPPARVPPQQAPCPASLTFSGRANGLTLESLQHTGATGAVQLVSRTRVLDPCDVAVQVRQGMRGKDVHLQATDLRVKVSPYLADLLTVLQSELVAPVLRASPDRPVASSRGFDLVTKLPLFLNGKPGALRVVEGWGNEVTIWKPRCPSGYCALGHALTVGSEPPLPGAVLVVGLNSGLAAHPIGFARVWPPRPDAAFSAALYSAEAEERGVTAGEGVHVWFPIAPEGFRALGCVVTDRPVVPDLVSVACLREEACVPSDLTETLRTCPEADESDFLDLVLSGASGGTFLALPRVVAQKGDWRMSDLAAKVAFKPRAPLGLSPLQLCQAVPWLLRDRERANLNLSNAAAGGNGGPDSGTGAPVATESPCVRMGPEGREAELVLPEWMLAAAGEALEGYRASVQDLCRLDAPGSSRTKSAAASGAGSLLKTTAEFRKIWWSREPSMDPKPIRVTPDEPVGLGLSPPSSKDPVPSHAPPPPPPPRAVSRLLRTIATAATIVTTLADPAAHGTAADLLSSLFLTPGHHASTTTSKETDAAHGLVSLGTAAHLRDVLSVRPEPTDIVLIDRSTIPQQSSGGGEEEEGEGEGEEGRGWTVPFSFSGSPEDGATGVGADGLSLWNPIPPSGYKPLGHSLVHGFLSPLEGWVVADDSEYVRPPVSFDLVWRIPGRERVRALNIWKPLAPEGFVALGYVATAEGEKPAVDAIRVIRADVAQGIELPRPTWTVRTKIWGEQVVDLSAYIVDDLTGLFVVDGPKGKANAYAVYRPAEDASAAAERESQASNVVVEVGRTSVLLCDMHGRPLVDFGLGEIRAGLHSPAPGTLSTVATLQMEAWSFHRQKRAWEPILEPWEAHVALETSIHGRGVSGAVGSSSPGMSLKISGMSEVLRLTVAHAAVDALIDAVAEWRTHQLRKSRGGASEDKAAAVLATQGSQARRTVRNLLNTDVFLRTDYGRSFGQAHLPPGTAAALALPQPEIPTRGGVRLTSPRLALAVTLGSLVLGPAPPAEHRRGEASVHPGDLLCVLSFSESDLGTSLRPEREEAMRVLPLTRSGYRLSSTSPSDASSSSSAPGAEFGETILLPFSPTLIAADVSHEEPVSVFIQVLRDKSDGVNVAARGSVTLSKATLRRLVKRAIDGDLAVEGKTPILCSLGESTVDLECPPGAAAGAAPLQLSCTLSLVVNQTAEPGQGRNARPLRGHTRGHRAVAVYSDGPWALLPPPATLRTYPALWNLTAALQLNCRTANAIAAPERAQRVGPGGAGQALTSSLTALSVGENPQIVVFEEVALPGEGAARVEIVRSLCQLFNATLVPHEVCIVMRDQAWVQDLRTAADLAPSVRHDEDFTLLADEEVFENQRFMPLRGWNHSFLSRLERQRFSDRLGVKSSASFPEVPLPSGWFWEGDWEIDRAPNTDADGFQYGIEFSRLSWPPKQGEERMQAMYVVRRRRYKRRRRRDHRAAAPPPSPPKNMVEGSAEHGEAGARLVELGVLQPGERMSLPLECFSSDLEVTVRFRPAEQDAPYEWSAIAAGGSAATKPTAAAAVVGARGIHLAELRDGWCALLKSSPASAASASGSGRDDEGSGFWTAAVVEGKTVAVHTRYGLERAYDWLVSLVPPLLLDNALPVPVQAILASEQGAGVFEGAVPAGEALPVHHVDPLLPLVLKFEPAGLQYDDRGPLRLQPRQILANARDGPTMLSCTFRTPEAASSGALRGPQLVSGFVSCRPTLFDGLDMDEWEQVEGRSNKSSATAIAAAASRLQSLYAPLQLRMFSPVSVENRSDLAVQLAVVDLGPVQRSDSRDEGVGLLGALESVGSSAAASSEPMTDGPTVMEVTDPRKPLRSSPVCASLVGAASRGLASYPIQQVNELFGLQLRVEGSGWSDPLPLANHVGSASANGNGNGNAAAATGASSAFLLRFQDHASGLVKDVIVSIDLSQDRESSLQIRIDPVYMVSNRTPFPLFLRDPGGLAVSIKPGESLRALHFSAKHARSPRVYFGLEPSDSVLSSALRLQDAAVATEAIVMVLRCRASLAAAAGIVVPARPLATPSSSGSADAAILQLPLRAKVDCLSSGAIHLSIIAVGGAGPYALANLSLGSLGFKTPGVGWQSLSAFSARDLTAAWSEVEQPAPRLIELAAGPTTEQGGPRARVLTLEHPTAGETGRRDRAFSFVPITAAAATAAPGKRMGKLQVAAAAAAAKPAPLVTEVGLEEGLLAGDSASPLVLRVRMPTRQMRGLGRSVSAAAAGGARGGAAASAAAASSSAGADSEETEPTKTRFTLGLTIPSVEVSVVDHLPRELLLIGLRTLAVEFAAGLGVQGASSVRLRVGDLIVNDQRPFSTYPVVLYKDPRKSHKHQPLFTIALTRVPSRPPFSALPLIYVHVNGRLITSIDESLIWRCLEAAQQVNLARLSPSKLAVGGAGIAARGTGRGRDPASPKTAPAPSAAASVPEMVLDLGVLHLVVPSVRFFFAANELHRPRSLKGNALMGLGLALGSVEGLKLPSAVLDRENEVVRSSALRRAVMDLVVTNVLRALPSLLWSASWGKGIGKAIGSVQQGVDSVLSAISGEERLLGPDSREASQATSLMEGMIGGAESVGKGLFKGFTGLITKPMEGAKKDGIAGAAKGLFQGVIGVAASPISGVVQGVARAAEGAVSEVQTRTKQVAGGGAELSRVLLGTAHQSGEDGSGTMERIRLPRQFGSDQVLVPFDEAEAKGQDLCWTALKSRQVATDMTMTEKILSAERLCESERFEWARALDGSPNAILLATSARILMLESRPGEVKVLWDCLYTEILGFELEMTRQAFDRKAPPDVVVVHLKGSPPAGSATTRATGFLEPVESLRATFLGPQSSAGESGPAPVFRRDIYCRTGGDLAVQLRAVLRATYRSRLPPDAVAVPKILSPEVPITVQASALSSAPSAASLQALGAATPPRPLHRREASAAGPSPAAPQSLDAQALVALAMQVPCVKFESVWRGRRDDGPNRSLTIWRPVGPPGYYAVGDVLRIGMDEPDSPVLVYRESEPSPAALDREESGLKRSAGGAASGPPLAPPIGYTLIWRDAGGKGPKACGPVTIWVPEAPLGYVAVGCVARADLLEPPLDAVRCVRKDLVRVAAYKSHATWEAKARDTLGWSVVAWEAANAAGTFMAVRNGKTGQLPGRDPLEVLIATGSHSVSSSQAEDD